MDKDARMRTQACLPLASVCVTLLVKFVVASKGSVVIRLGPGSFCVTPYAVLTLPLLDAIQCPVRISEQFRHKSLSSKRNK